MNHILRAAILNALLITGTGLAVPATAQAQPATLSYQVPAGDLDTALKRFASQSRIQLIYSAPLVEGKRSAGLKGSFQPEQALTRLLQGQGLGWDRVDDTTYVLREEKRQEGTPKPAPPPSTPMDDAKAGAEEDVKNMPAIMVTGAKTLNMDIMRTEDDPQPYVVFDREQIERSGSTSLEQFLQQRLTMNASTVNTGLGEGGVATSQVALRGLSSQQTLILVDGHRVSGPAISGSGQGILGQADITGLPLGAIERIEVLPTTASGIYGGSATGGVINIILRRNYSGGEIKVNYNNTFNTDTAGRKIDITFGRNFNSGRTSLLLTANYADANKLLADDRTFSQHGREEIWRNNPGFFIGPTGRGPLGATPNISSADGSNLILKEGTPLGAAFTFTPEGYAGPGSDNGVGLVENAGSYNWNPAGSAQEGPSNGGARQALYTQPNVKSAALVMQHQASDQLRLFADLAMSHSVSRYLSSGVASEYRIPASSPTNPFIQDIWVTVPMLNSDSNYSTTTKHHRGVVGFIQKMPRDWLLGADYTWDETTIINESPNTTSPAFTTAVTSGQINVIRDTGSFPIDISSYTVDRARFTSPFKSTMNDISLRASGPLGHLQGGTPTLSTSLSNRHETIEDAFWFSPNPRIGDYFFPERSQKVTSAYIELALPLFSEQNFRPGFRKLDLQFALRYDKYYSQSGQQLIFSNGIPEHLPEAPISRNTFESTDPTVALRWEPLNYLTLRASYGTGFSPPGLDQITPILAPGVITFGIDPLRGGDAAGPFTYSVGGSADLKPERSKSWSAGAIVSSGKDSSWRLSIDYTRIKKTDNIARHPGGLQGVINDELLFPGRVIRGPNFPDDPQGWAGPITHVDWSMLNLANAKLEAWDVQFDVRMETSEIGIFDIFFMGTWQPHYNTRLIATQPETENAGISASNPLKFKANAGAVWTHRGLRVGWNAQHYGGYKVSASEVSAILAQGSGGRIPSQTYHDVFVGYDFGLTESNAFPSWMRRIEMQLGVQNVLGKSPPFDASNRYGFYSKFGDPRLASYYMTITARF